MPNQPNGCCHCQNPIRIHRTTFPTHAVDTLLMQLHDLVRVVATEPSLYLFHSRLIQMDLAAKLRLAECQYNYVPTTQARFDWRTLEIRLVAMRQDMQEIQRGVETHWCRPFTNFFSWSSRLVALQTNVMSQYKLVCDILEQWAQFWQGIS